MRVVLLGARCTCKAVGQPSVACTCLAEGYAVCDGCGMPAQVWPADVVEA